MYTTQCETFRPAEQKQAIVIFLVFFVLFFKYLMTIIKKREDNSRKMHCIYLHSVFDSKTCATVVEIKERRNERMRNVRVLTSVKIIYCTILYLHYKIVLKYVYVISCYVIYAVSLRCSEHLLRHFDGNTKHKLPQPAEKFSEAHFDLAWCREQALCLYAFMFVRLSFGAHQKCMIGAFYCVPAGCCFQPQ